MTFEIADESEGTERMIDLLPAFFELTSPKTDKVFFIDELDRSLHTHLTRGLIESFLQSRTTASRAQLLFTTHDPLLLIRSFSAEMKFGSSTSWRTAIPS